MKINEVPVTKSGKTDRKKLVSMYTNETVTKSDSDFCRKEEWEKERIISLLTRLAKKYAKRNISTLDNMYDILTKGYKKKYGRWRKYIKGDFELYESADAGHFLVEDNAREVYDIISKVLNK